MATRLGELRKGLVLDCALSAKMTGKPTNDGGFDRALYRDESGFGNHGQVVTTGAGVAQPTSTTNWRGHSNGAISFVALQQAAVNFGTIPQMPDAITAISASCWVRKDDLSGTRYLFGRAKPAVLFSWYFAYNAGAVFVKMFDAGATSAQADSDTSSWTSDHWRYIAFSWPNSTDKIYLYMIDDWTSSPGTPVLQADQPSFTGPIRTSTQGYFATNVTYPNASYSNIFQGAISRVRLWNRVLSAEEFALDAREYSVGRYV